MLNIILFIVSILLVIYSVYALQHTHKINKNIDLLNKSLKEESDYLKQEIKNIISASI